MSSIKLKHRPKNKIPGKPPGASVGPASIRSDIDFHAVGSPVSGRPQEAAAAAGGHDMDFPTRHRGPGRLRVHPPLVQATKGLGRHGSWDHPVAFPWPNPRGAGPRFGGRCYAARPRSQVLRRLRCPGRSRAYTPALAGAPVEGRGAPPVPSNPESRSSPPGPSQPALPACSVQAVVAALAADPTFTAAIAAAVSASFPRPQVDGVGPSSDEALRLDNRSPDMDLSFLE
ncbi:hypothetical protein MTO96_038722 [Rhipicephalus appendiculatus]